MAGSERDTDLVVADAEKLSASNLHELDEANLRVIVASRMTKPPNNLASHSRWHGEALADVQLIGTSLTALFAGGRGVHGVGIRRPGGGVLRSW